MMVKVKVKVNISPLKQKHKWIKWLSQHVWVLCSPAWRWPRTFSPANPRTSAPRQLKIEHTHTHIKDGRRTNGLCSSTVFCLWSWPDLWGVLTLMSGCKQWCNDTIGPSVMEPLHGSQQVGLCVWRQINPQQQQADVSSPGSADNFPTAKCSAHRRRFCSEHLGQILCKENVQKLKGQFGCGTESLPEGWWHFHVLVFPSCCSIFEELTCHLAEWSSEAWLD